MADLLTAAAAAHNLQVAIEYGELREQQAPGGHPIFAAVDRAREMLTWVEQQESTPGWPPSGLPPGNTRDRIDQTISDIHEASSTILNDPDLGPPSTIWPALQALPWGWIAAGAGGLVLVGVLFQRRGAAT